MPPFLKFQDEQDALSLKFLRPSVKKLVFWPIRAHNPLKVNGTLALIFHIL